MLYSNLSNKETILLWIKQNPNSIHQKDDNGLLLLDWICGDYRGLSNIKSELIDTLISKGGTLENTSNNTFTYIIEDCLLSNRKNKNTVSAIAQQNKHLTSYKQSMNWMKIFRKSYSDDDFFDIKKDILFKDVSVYFLTKFIWSFCSLSNNNPTKKNYCENLLFMLKDNKDIILSSIYIQEETHQAIGSQLFNFKPGQTMLDVFLSMNPRNEQNEEFIRHIESLENFKSLQSKLLKEGTTKQAKSKI